MPSFLTKRALIALLLILFGVGVLYTVSYSVRSSVSSLLAPVQGALWSSGITTSEFLAGTFAFKGTMQAELTALRAENEALLKALVQLTGVKEENERFREALGIVQESGWDLMLAEVIGKESGRDVLFVNKGVKDGISQGMPVITQSGVAVGSVGAVYDHTSQISLLSAAGQVSDVRIQGKNAIGALSGRGGLKAGLGFILRETDLSEGDLVVTSALGGVFPDGFLVGEVEDVERSDASSFQGGEVRLFFTLREANSLFIITNYQ